MTDMWKNCGENTADSRASDPLVSVVVPVYKVEKYLDRCVSSIAAQTLKEIEIILVDDGSPDQCPAMCDEWAKKDARVRVIHQKNAGLGPARNSGMVVARGEYVGFVDSDDWVKPEMYERLYQAAKACDADIAVSGHRDVAGKRVLVTKVHPLAGQTLISEAEIRGVRNLLFGHAPWEKEVESFPMSVWASVYKRTMVDKYCLKFQEILSEDTIFNLSAYRRAKVITFTDGTDYCYRKENQVSITNTFSPRKQDRCVQFVTEIARIAEEEGAECILRAKRTAIDYCRIYVGLVERSNLTFSEKTAAVRRFAETEEIRLRWKEYPVETLPAKQRIFHFMIEKKCYALALLLSWARYRLHR